MKILSLVLSLISTPALAKPGFITALDPSVPAAVREASKGVFSLIVLADDESTYSHVSLATLEQQAQTWANAPDSQARRVAQVAQVYAQRCKAQRLSLCPSPLSAGAIAGGSAVLIGASGTELWTASHVFEEPLRQALRSSGFSDVRELARRRWKFKTLIFNHEGRLVADPFSNPMHLSFAATGKIIGRLEPDLPVDQLQFELEKPIGRGLDAAPSDISAGVVTYSVGYPSCTGCSNQFASLTESLMSGSRAPYRDATAYDHQLTVGHVLERRGLVITTDADAQDGMSGGATLDEFGRVIGLNSAVNVSVNFLIGLEPIRLLRILRPQKWPTSVQAARM